MARWGARSGVLQCCSSGPSGASVLTRITEYTLRDRRSRVALAKTGGAMRAANRRSTVASTSYDSASSACACAALASPSASNATANTRVTDADAVDAVNAVAGCSRGSEQSTRTLCPALPRLPLHVAPGGSAGAGKGNAWPPDSVTSGAVPISVAKLCQASVIRAPSAASTTRQSCVAASTVAVSVAAAVAKAACSVRTVGSSNEMEYGSAPCVATNCDVYMILHERVDKMHQLQAQ